MTILILAVLASLLSWIMEPRASTEMQPALTLPDPSPDEVAMENWSGDGPLSNSVRAWHYNPSLVQPLLEVGGAVEDSVLTRVTRHMLTGVVAARNYCFY
jgi:hypothetical protein